MSETPMRLSQVSVPLPPSLRSWVAPQGLRRRRQDRSVANQAFVCRCHVGYIDRYIPYSSASS